MEKIPSPQENKYHILKSSFLNGNLSFEEVRNKLLDFDQETNEREASDDNLSFLKDPEIYNLVSKSEDDLNAYHGFLSLTEFHIGQRLAFQNSEEAITFLQNSLNSAETGKMDEGWISYIKGTLIYSTGKEIPQDVIEKVDNETNKNILEKLNQGLKERGFPDYKLDY